MDFDYLKDDYNEVHRYLHDYQFIFQEVPTSISSHQPSGEAYALAYPIQGLLKYHGLSNTHHRLAFFPSISLNNDVASTITFVKFSENFTGDRLILNGQEYNPDTREYQRVIHQLNEIRQFALVSTKALIISQNILKSTSQIATGKGLGTSASAGAAIAHASLKILYPQNPEIYDNPQLRSHLARYLAGSATRSTVGGIGLWLNYPNISPKDSVAIRLDRESDQEFLSNIALITISLESSVKTEQAHEIAPHSPFFSTWLHNRKSHIQKFCEALFSHDFQSMGEMAENDTFKLHAITMTAPPAQNLLVWEPDTVAIMHLVKTLRKKGIQAYFSIDTGPSVVILTLTHHVSEIITELKVLNPDFKITSGKIAGPSQIIEATSQEAKFLSKDLQRYNAN
jgi:diphosphomevalonate decarboxylase